jgi:hypothetical protein
LFKEEFEAGANITVPDNIYNPFEELNSYIQDYNMPFNIDSQLDMYNTNTNDTYRRLNSM